MSTVTVLLRKKSQEINRRQVTNMNRNEMNVSEIVLCIITLSNKVNQV